MCSCYIYCDYDDMGCWVFKRGVQNWKDFCLAIITNNGNCWILRIGVIGRCQKLGIILENEVIQKLKKIPMMLKVKFCLFLTPPHYTNYKNSIISFGYVDFSAKILLFRAPQSRNSIMPPFAKLAPITAKDSHVISIEHV